MNEKFSQIEEVVNSKEVEDYSQDDAPSWEATWAFIKSRIEGAWAPSFWESLEADLHDWWANGNLRHWDEDEVNGFGMTRWRLGDEEFWLLDNDGEVLLVGW